MRNLPLLWHSPTNIVNNGCPLPIHLSGDRFYPIITVTVERKSPKHVVSSLRRKIPRVSRALGSFCSYAHRSAYYQRSLRKSGYHRT